MIVRINQSPKVWLDHMVARGKKEFFNLPDAIMITPHLATVMLGRNLPGNRLIRQGKIDSYASDMKNGDWRVTSQGISFNANGYLDNGQHRLMAVIRSGCEVPMSVSFGQAENVYPTLDAGSARTAGDVLKYKGIPMGPLVAATAGRVESVRLGATTSRSKRFSHSEILELVEENPLLLDAARLSMKIKKLRGSPSAIATGLYFCLRDDLDKANEMVDRLHDGVGLGVDDPVRIMREALLTNRYAKDEQASFILAADIVNTFVAFCRGRKRRAKWLPGQPFPLAD